MDTTKEIARLTAKLTRIQALLSRPGTAGEHAAAREQYARIYARRHRLVCEERGWPV